MLAALPVFLGVHFLSSFLAYDFQNVPKQVLHRRLGYEILSGHAIAALEIGEESQRNDHPGAASVPSPAP